MCIIESKGLDTSERQVRIRKREKMGYPQVKDLEIEESSRIRTF